MLDLIRLEKRLNASPSNLNGSALRQNRLSKIISLVMFDTIVPNNFSNDEWCCKRAQLLREYQLVRFLRKAVVVASFPFILSDAKKTRRFLGVSSNGPKTSALLYFERIIFGEHGHQLVWERKGRHNRFAFVKYLVSGISHPSATLKNTGIGTGHCSNACNF